MLCSGLLDHVSAFLCHTELIWASSGWRLLCQRSLWSEACNNSNTRSTSGEIYLLEIRLAGVQGRSLFLISKECRVELSRKTLKFCFSWWLLSFHLCSMTKQTAMKGRPIKLVWFGFSLMAAYEKKQQIYPEISSLFSYCSQSLNRPLVKFQALI